MASTSDSHDAVVEPAFVYSAIWPDAEEREKSDKDMPMQIRVAPLRLPKAVTDADKSTDDVSSAFGLTETSTDCESWMDDLFFYSDSLADSGFQSLVDYNPLDDYSIHAGLLEERMKDMSVAEAYRLNLEGTLSCFSSTEMSSPCDLPSVGSAQHFFGTCKPCSFACAKKPKICLNGRMCVYCHLCPPNEKQTRKRARRQVETKVRLATEFVTKDEAEHVQREWKVLRQRAKAKAQAKIVADHQTTGERLGAEVATIEEEKEKEEEEGEEKEERLAVEAEANIEEERVPQKLVEEAETVQHSQEEVAIEESFSADETFSEANLGATLVADSSYLPSVGSSQHYLGTCKPCTHAWRNCKNGENCAFCHLCPPGEKQKRKKEIRHKIALRNAAMPR